MSWPDGTGRWYWRGIELPASVAERLPGLSGRDVASIGNVELRRIAVVFLESGFLSCRALDEFADRESIDCPAGGGGEALDLSSLIGSEPRVVEAAP